MKRFICIILMLLLSVCMFSCGADNTSEVISKEESSEEPAPVIYTIVYFRIYDDEAQALADAVKEKSGLDFPVVKYTSGYAIPENSVVIGTVSDGIAETLTVDMNKRDYGVKGIENRFYIYGGGMDAVKSCVTYFAENLITARGIELGKDFNYYYDYPYPLEGAAINGVPLGDFDIIYASTENEAKYGDVASLFGEYLDEQADIDISDYSEAKAEGENEIFIGIADGRELVGGYKESDFEYNAYKVIVSGTKVAVIGNNACAVYNGCLALADYISASDNKNAADTVIDGSCTLVKVACVGDSITKGANSTYPNIQNYPAYLQQMLGYSYYVKNFGIDGYSLINTDEYAYNKTSEYTASKTFKPDVVLFMLGTNDCNPGQNYKDWTKPERTEKYKESAKEFFDSYYAINANVQIFMSIPSTLFESTVWPWEEWAARIVAYAVPLNKEIAEENNLPTIDMYTWSLDNIDVFTDGLHPKDESYKRYAKRVYDEIIDEIVKPEDLNK